MKVVQITQYRGPDVLICADVPDPAPGPGEAIVLSSPAIANAVAAASGARITHLPITAEKVYRALNDLK